jgi:hypothetical protein
MKMNIREILQKNKQRIQTMLLIMLVISPIVMFIGIQIGLLPLIYLGLALIILANVTAVFT